MKKVILSSVVVVGVLVFSGCGKVPAEIDMVVPSVEEVVKDTVSDEVDNTKKVFQHKYQELMQKSVKIQQDKTMTKEEKAAALEKLQKQIKEISDNAVAE